MKKVVTLVFLAIAFVSGWAQQTNSYIPYKTFDGEHKNEISGYVMGGNNVVTDKFGGLAVSYTRHLTPRWHVGGDAQMQFGKELFSVDVQGGYRLPLKYGNISFDGKIMYNCYHKFGFHEMAYNISATWESAYVDIRLGETLVHYHSHVWGFGWGYTETPLLTFGFGATSGTWDCSSGTTTCSTMRTGTSTGVSVGMLRLRSVGISLESSTFVRQVQ